MEKTIEIPEGYEARIEGNKVVLELKESEDERIRKEIMEYLTITREKDLVAHPERQRWITYLEKQKEQKPAGWSEEDEKMLRNVYESLYAYQCDIRAGIMNKNSRELLDDVEKEKQWLKFHLRPQSHWKPSKEQIEAVYNILHPDDPYYDELKSLYEQLKKL